MANPTVYETGTADNVVHLIQKLETFAIAQGWAIDNSTLAAPYASIDYMVDYSAQTGEILAESSPLYSNTSNGTFHVDNGIITVADLGEAYHTTLPLEPGSSGYEIEVRFEIISRVKGTLRLMLGAGTSLYFADTVGKHIYSDTMGVQEWVRFYSDDFAGTFRLTTVIQRMPGITLSLHKENVGYFHMTSSAVASGYTLVNPGPYIYFSASNSYVEGSAYNAHPGATSPAARSNGLDEIPNGGNFHAYYFFASAKHIYIVIEPIEGEFSHMGFGISRKYFDFRGGQFVYGTYWRHDGYQNNMDWDFHSLPIGYRHFYSMYNTYRADLVGTPTDQWLLETDQSAGFTIQEKLYGTYYGHTSQEYMENPYYGTSPLAPVYLAGYDHNGYIYSLGEMEEYRKIFCKYIDPKTVLAINGEQWMVFPIKRKQLTTPDEYVSNSENYALAYYIGDVP